MVAAVAETMLPSPCQHNAAQSPNATARVPRCLRDIKLWGNKPAEFQSPVFVVAHREVNVHIFYSNPDSLLHCDPLCPVRFALQLVRSLFQGTINELLFGPRLLLGIEDCNEVHIRGWKLGFVEPAAEEFKTEAVQTAGVIADHVHNVLHPVVLVLR